VTGCLPADAAYFVVYELMKRHLNFNNEKIDLATTATIGATATIAHDFFITPGDSKIQDIGDLIMISDQAKTLAPASPLRCQLRQGPHPV
jgi:hypothetical protein